MSIYLVWSDGSSSEGIDIRRERMIGTVAEATEYAVWYNTKFPYANMVVVVDPQ